MATLVLSTVGTALGGPVGAAIGALIGQSIDQQILGQPSRGPRLSDLSVQTSSYGTQIPRIYGSMRVAGSVIWATDLVESTQTTGAKGQPDATYSYSVSLAVALSSRRVESIGRIWADGKLLRGTDGEFRVNTTFRFYDGSENQPIDPLIGSTEGPDSTPAYRGLALAVFENLELAEFGNRIPFLTFEIVADPVGVAAILSDATGGIVECDTDRTVIGYAAHGSSIHSAIEPLVESYAIALVDDGSRLRGPQPDAIMVAEEEFGCSASSETAPRIEREQSPAASTAATLRMSYYDSSRDYQSGEARASSGDRRGTDERIELPAVIAANDAKALVQETLARRWAQRDKLVARLPPARMSLEPGMAVDLPLAPTRWVVEKCTIEAFVTIAELRPRPNIRTSMEADAGRFLPPTDTMMSALSIALLDVPEVLGSFADTPSVLLAASSPSSAWRTCNVEISGPIQQVLTTARRRTVLGHALNALAPAAGYLIDETSFVDVELVNQDQWLVSCTDQDLAGGANLAVLGSEVIQFASATLLSPGRFRLGRLLRCRGGTEWAAEDHLAGEVFALLDPAAVQAVDIPTWAKASRIVATVEHPSAQAEILATCETVRPLAPVHLHANRTADGSLSITWIRRCRRNAGWIDEVEIPIGEAREEYRVSVSGMTDRLERLVELPAITLSAAEIATIGTGPATIAVRQVGDHSASRPATKTILI